MLVRKLGLLHLALSAAVLGQDTGQGAPRQAGNPLASLSRSFEQLVDRIRPSVVQVVAQGFTDSSSGSGVVVDTSGYIVTNAHVVGSARRVHVRVPISTERAASAKSVLKPAGRLVPARVVGFDRETDIALLKVAEKLTSHVTFGDSEELRQGQLVFAFGSPFGLENSVTMGVVSSPARQVQPDGPMIYIQTDAPINPGNSGGPLVDATGTMVGISTFIVSPSGGNAGVGFAVPSNIVSTVVDAIKKNGYVRRGQVGVQAQTSTPELAAALGLTQQSGVLVADVVPRSSAEAGGLQINDILLTLDGKRLENARQFGVNIYGKAGQTVAIELLRGAEKVTTRVAVLERPPDREQMLSRVEGKLLEKLAVVAADLDQKVTPLLPGLRRLSGVVVTAVVDEPAGIADALIPGDVIYTVNGKSVGSVKELEAALAGFGPGQNVALHLERLGQLQYALLELR